MEMCKTGSLVCTDQAVFFYNLNQNNPRCKKVLVMMTSLQNIVIAGDQGLLILKGSKFVKDDQATKYYNKKNDVLW